MNSLKDPRRNVDLNRRPEKTAFPTLYSKTNIKKEHKNHYSFEFVVEGFPSHKVSGDKK